jgi:hypothetical protein
MSFLKNFILNGIFVAILAHGMIGTSLVWDKILLKKQGMKNLLSYVFWLGAIGVFGLVVAFFGFHLPPPAVSEWDSPPEHSIWSPLISITPLSKPARPQKNWPPGVDLGPLPAT